MEKSNLTILLGLLISLACQKASAQLTVFNVSSSDITDKAKISAQQQFEINDQIESSTTVTFGVARNGKPD